MSNNTSHNDPVLTSFLKHQLTEGLALAESSERLALLPINGQPPNRYVARFDVRGRVLTPQNEVVEHHSFVVGIQFPPDYLRRFVPWEVLYLIGPRRTWHPNISFGAPMICPGRAAPGTSLVELLYQVWEILTYRKVNMLEHNALNQAACRWARANQLSFPTDTRPLKHVTTRAPKVELLKESQR
ncbi:MAG: hypothetical protein ACKVX7_09610 [Planctomycetota bacterium]